jgi:hypothetical protein
MQIFAVSDLHVDFPPNMEWLRALDPAHYASDAIIVAGDVTDDLNRLEEVFSILRRTFAHVFFVPGNHELWVRRGEWRDSLQKFEAVADLCRRHGVKTEAEKLGSGDGSVWVVPLYSWYAEPEEGHTSLFVPKPGEDPSLELWSDRYFIRWPRDWKGNGNGNGNGNGIAGMFLEMNEPSLRRDYDAPVISFSHFLPRRELLFGSHIDLDRKRDPHPQFNFSRVAGCSGIDRQLRRLPSRLHVYGHQHRNRDVVIDGVRYLSNCRGYPKEREAGYLPANGRGLELVWSAASGRLGA